MLARSIENFKNQIKPCLCQKKPMVMQLFFPRFLPRKRLKIHKYCGSISCLSSPLWLKTSQIFRHMANIFGDVASGQRQHCNTHKLYNNVTSRVFPRNKCRPRSMVAYKIYNEDVSTQTTHRSRVRMAGTHNLGPGVWGPAPPPLEQFFLIYTVSCF